MARHIKKTILATTLIIFQSITGVFANVTVYDEKIETTVLMEGLTYKEIARATDKGFLDIYILEYDLNSENIDLDILRNNEEWDKRTSLSSMVLPETLAGVNASFFDTSATYSDILGFEVEEGEITYAKNEYNRNWAQTSSLNLKEDGTATLGYISNQIVLATETGTTVYVNSVNGMQDFSNTTIFTGNVVSNSAVADSKADLYKVVFKEGRVVRVVPPKTIAYLNEDEMAIVTPDESVVNLFPLGAGVVYYVSTNLGDALSNYELILSGGGTILKDGQVLQDGLQVSANVRAPRTAVGTTEDNKLITMVVDGRGMSIGATFDEMAQLLLEQGVTNAIHFDGGGSSEIVALNYNNANVIQNVPSDGKERNIANGLGFSSTVTDSYLASIVLESSEENLFINNSTTLTIKGYDQYGRAYFVDDSSGIYSVEGLEGTFSGNTFIPTTAGIGIVKVMVGNVESQIPINVVEVAKDITVRPASKTISPYENVKLNSTVTSYENNTMPLDLNNATVTLVNPEMGRVDNGYFYSNGTLGVAYIQISFAGITKTIAVDVSNSSTETVYNLNDTFSTLDNKYINYQDAINQGFQEILMLGRIEVDGVETALRGVTEVNTLGQNSALKIFSGGIGSPAVMNFSMFNYFGNKFSESDYESLNTKIINLENYETNANSIIQLANLKAILNGNTRQNVIVQCNRDYLATTRYSKLLREALNDYAKTSGANVYFVNGNADRGNVNVDNVDSVTYIQMPMEKLSLDSSNTISNDIYFYLDTNGTLRYSFK